MIGCLSANRRACPPTGAIEWTPEDGLTADTINDKHRD